ncbi:MULTISPECIES: sensor histidine kinase [Pseudoalteromonas]|uniref:histidine kinase n=1 Tax=Pseudoalteromonas amylolytica TaxID=1859457 RepID=A0A1S1MU59_9GAMM|nr:MULTISPECIES: HAMP domain-containing sensor histidine kinase [Pseudoalteromonas]OHU85029.1 two-component sensor histidine kinase [Pseudoalteromonas sp. JW3]OHU90020.1 two-component sensor histidine kinase [Pseudoalteromonas amylolytica]
MNFRQHSLAKKIYLHFLLIGSAVFTLIGVTLYLFSINFANLAVESSMYGMSEDIVQQLHFDEQQRLQYHPENVAEKWGYDALFNNLAFRVVEQNSGQVILNSISSEAGSQALAALDSALPKGYSHQAGIDRYRLEYDVQGTAVYVDLARNDLIGEFANEAVMPVLSQVSIVTMVAAFVVFMLVGFLSIRSIVRPVREVASQLEAITPEQLSFRLSSHGLPIEIQPIVNSLNQAMDRVETGFDEQKRFVANAAHELKTPLAVLNTRVQLADMDSATSEGVLADVGYMTRVVQQLLDLSRAQRQFGNERSPLSLLMLSKEVCMMLAPLAVSLDKELSLEPDESGELVQADKAAVHIMVKNLIENALRHSKDKASIIVRTSNNYIEVLDNGPGIDEENKDKLFERFWRKEQSVLTGSGLGLAIVKEIAHRHQAHLTVKCKNELGGATFKVLF